MFDLNLILFWHEAFIVILNVWQIWTLRYKDKKNKEKTTLAQINKGLAQYSSFHIGKCYLQISPPSSPSFLDAKGWSAKYTPSGLAWLFWENTLAVLLPLPTAISSIFRVLGSPPPRQSHGLAYLCLTTWSTGKGREAATSRRTFPTEWSLQFLLPVLVLKKCWQRFL